MMHFATGISEIVLVVEDVPTSTQFYREVVGLVPEMEPTDAWAWFNVGTPEDPQRLALRNGPLGFEEHSPHPEGERWGEVHFALEVPRERLDEAVAHVRQQDVTVYGPQYFEWMKAKAYYFYDPDGNLIEFWSPDPK